MLLQLFQGVINLPLQLLALLFQCIQFGGLAPLAAENLLQMLVKTSSNAEFIEQLKLQMRLIDKEGYTFRGTGLK